jgi:hypothetical protein
MASQEDVQIARDLYKELRGITSELKGQENEITKSRKAFRAFEDVAQKFKLNQEDISKLNDKELKDLRKKLVAQTAIAKQEGESLKNSLSNRDLIQEEVDKIKERIKLNAKGLSSEEQAAEQSARINDLLNYRLKSETKLTEEQKALIAASFDEYQVVGDINKELEKELAIREEANRLMGVAGGLLSTLNAFGGNFAKSLKLDQVEADMAAVADEIARGERSAGLLGGRMSVLAAGVKSAFGGLSETLTDPSVVLGAIAKSYGEYEKSAREIRQETGISSAQLTKVAYEAAPALNGSLVNSIDAVKTIASLTQQVGMNVTAAFSPETIGAAADLATLTGLSADSTANLALRAEVFGDSLGDARGQAIEITQEFAESGKGALNFKSVLGDAGKASNSLALSIKGGQKGLVEAAAGAAALGLNLAKAEAIADKLLDFESSISAELEAELLTGQSLNLEKARTAALNNDIATLTEEIGSNQAIMEAFSSGNRIQQEAIAKSLGMQKEDVAKMILFNEKNKNLTLAERAAAAGISEEEATRLSTQQQITKAVEKMTAALAPAISFMASLLSNSFVLYTTMGLIGTIFAVKIAGSLVSSVRDMGKLAQGARSLLSGSRGGGATSGVSGAIGRGGAATGQAANATRSVGAGGARQGQGVFGFLKGLGRGLAFIGMQFANVLKGVLALALFAPAAVLAVASIPFLAFMAIPGVGVGIGTGLTALGTGLAALGTVAATGVAFLGPALIAALGVALIPFAFSLKLVTPLIAAFGQIIIGVLGTIPPIIEAIAGGIGMLLTSLVDNLIKLADPKIALGLVTLAPGLFILGSAMAYLGAISPFILAGSLALGTLGMAMLPLSMGFEKMAGANAEGLIQSLSQFTLLAPGLLSTSTSLFALAGGLGAIAVAGLAAIPVMTALAGLGTVATGISEVLGIGGGEGESGEDGTDKLAKKLDKLNENVVKLIGVVQQGGVVEIDGNRAGTAFSLGATSLA